VAHLGQDLMRATVLSDNGAQVSTPEHLLAALRGMGIDNVLIELNGPELPILDGSAQPWMNLIHQAQWTEQSAERDEFVLDKPVTISEGNRSLIALPYDGFKITCTSADDYGRLHHTCRWRLTARILSPKLGRLGLSFSTRN
jgi:UDP-3-O-[3-hydroxymyristoyl] N-acetylglucosamine deacetylase/3-hydroxyacyl-[acyl-carrier-protein] dehydratase